MINITVNNKSYQFKTEISINEVLSTAKIPVNGIAVAVNQEIISKSDWSNRFVKNQDNILIIQATQGG